MVNNHSNAQTINKVDTAQNNCKEVLKLENQINSEENLLKLHAALIESELLINDCINNQQRADSHKRTRFLSVTKTVVPEIINLLDINANSWSDENKKEFKSIKFQIEKLLKIQTEIIALFPDFSSYENMVNVFTAKDIKSKYVTELTKTQDRLNVLKDKFKSYLKSILTKLKKECK